MNSSIWLPFSSVTKSSWAPIRIHHIWKAGVEDRAVVGCGTDSDSCWSSPLPTLSCSLLPSSFPWVLAPLSTPSLSQSLLLSVAILFSFPLHVIWFWSLLTLHYLLPSSFIPFQPSLLFSSLSSFHELSPTASFPWIFSLLLISVYFTSEDLWASNLAKYASLNWQSRVGCSEAFPSARMPSWRSMACETGKQKQWPFSIRGILPAMLLSDLQGLI